MARGFSFGRRPCPPRSPQGTASRVNSTRSARAVEFRRGLQPGEVATESFGDQVLDAIVGTVQALAAATGLATLELSLAQRTQVLLEARQAVRPQRRRPIDVAQAPRRGRLRAAEDHPALDLLGPHRQPQAPAARTLAQLFPFGQLDHRPELPILLTLLDEASERVAPAALRRWVRTSGPAGRPIDALTQRDFGAFEDALAELERRGFVVRRQDGGAPGG